MENNKYVSKILLFGEYSIIKNSMALAIPFELFSGELKFQKDKKIIIDSELKSFINYLKSVDEKGQLNDCIDIFSFEFDIGQGLYFDSTIPQGYGVGSSAALCAAIFDRYKKDDRKYTFEEHKEIFSILESHFHGSSSGIDPLISFFKKPTLINNKSELSFIAIPDYAKGNGGFFLLNTQRHRRTEPLVNLFLEKCKSPFFSSLCEDVLNIITNRCIENFLEGNIKEMEKAFAELSDFQFRHFSPMIPKLYQPLWEKGLETKKFYLKLCGAGGGGFILGMTNDFSGLGKILETQQIRPVLRF